MRKIPSVMATQHPDSATRFIGVREEPEEAVNCLTPLDDGLGCQEYLVDYMGKLTPYHQIALIVKALKEKTPLTPGEEVYITPRMVSDFSEEPFRQLITLLAVTEGIYYSNRYYRSQGVKEVVQAMPESVTDLVNCYNRANCFFPILERELKLKFNEELRIIPLFEGMSELANLNTILTDYISRIKVKDYLRIFLGKSETAAQAGHPASILLIRLALSEAASLKESLGLDIYPILGGGSLPFRGGISPENLENFTELYRGTSTYTIQSGTRYDHSSEEVKQMISSLPAMINLTPPRIEGEDRRGVLHAVSILARNYLRELNELLEYIVEMMKYVPDQRERVLAYHDVAYYRRLRNIPLIFKDYGDRKTLREVDKLDLKKFQAIPRAIKLSASLYSCGIPPEFLGVGKGLEEIEEEMGEKWCERILREFLPSLPADITFSSRFYAPTFLETKRIKEGIRNLKSRFEFAEREDKHAILVETALSIVFKKKTGEKVLKKFALQIAPDEVSEYLDDSSSRNVSKLILDMGRIRKSLG